MRSYPPHAENPQQEAQDAQQEAPQQEAENPQHSEAHVVRAWHIYEFACRGGPFRSGSICARRSLSPKRNGSYPPQRLPHSPHSTDAAAASAAP